MNLSERIRELRIKTGMTQEALAEKCGVGIMTANRWENGGTPNLENLKALAEALKVPLAKLLED